MSARYIEKLESINGAISYVFPLAQHEAQVEQMYRTPTSQGVGANYAHDHLGYGVSPKDPRRISVRCLFKESSAANLQTEVDEALSECARIGLGYLYRLDVDGSTRRRCLARPTYAPSIVFNGNFQFGVMPVTFGFLGLSDWFATTATTGSRSISAGQSVITVTNAGNIPVLSGIVLTLTVTSAITFVTITNATNGTQMAWTGSGAVGQVLKFGDPDHAVGLAHPSMVMGVGMIGAAALGPVSYSNQYGNVTLGDSGFLTLEPGANQLVIDTDGAFTLADSHYGAFA